MEEETTTPTNAKQTYLENLISGISIRKDFSSESIFAGANTNEKRSNIRPVVLVSFYSNELVQAPSEMASPNHSFFTDKVILQVGQDSSGILFNDLSSAVKESLRAEKAIIQWLDEQKCPPKSTVYLTTETQSFFVSKIRLLGEILKAQRKIERARMYRTLTAQKPLEAFIKKLCTLKVLGDRAEFNRFTNFPAK
ncbi:hypothetical protein NEHOM01_0552 [Nematocida homosporus]|uniref:uncharacterized protein n=1 Tax=Nematocida homosporus TaxID=1912981 RepID=UPI0022203F7A|nr:uncharacterized protein NEHOM01_0552 [Nematocida homosporus]KAI5185001.1 hypothetical protein NEHOM01_0552 [Nematocida homosporus]